MKSNMMQYMSDDENLHKYYFLCKEKEFDKERKMILRKKSIKLLENSIELIKDEFFLNIEYYNDDDDDEYHISSITQSFSSDFYLNDYLNILIKNFFNENYQNVFNKNNNSYLLDGYSTIKHEIDIFFKIRNGHIITRNDFNFEDSFSIIYKNEKNYVNDHFYWTYRINSYSSNKSLLSLQLKALIY
jgi:hypothetical protein